ncbi:RNA exonuclease 4 [Amia ocellicauda]|uniref:RNA exonuclease 4 n=1 Tax=Amia ocellicauda TaxID=2972642 RepID=UPI003464325B
MSKAKPKCPDPPTVTATPGSTSAQQKNKSPPKKKKLWKTAGKGASKKDEGERKKSAVLPPKEAQQFSANWKALQELLYPKKEVKSQANESAGTNQNSKKEKNLKKDPKDIPVKDQTVKAVQVPTGKPTKDGTPPGTSDQNGTGVVEQQKTKEKKKRKNSQLPVEGKEEGSKKRKTEPAVGSRPTEEDIWFDDVDPDDVEATVGIDAANIMRKRQGVAKIEFLTTENALVKEHGFEGLTKAVAMDCEMVGVGYKGEDSIVARVSIVNQFGKCIYDKYVKPTEKVTDYRTAVSGIRPQDIKNGANVKVVQREVANIIQGRILVGHAIHNDLKILLLDHPKRKIRDTQKYKPFKQIVKCGRPSLKHLCEKILHVKVQQTEHSSVQDAQATMRLYTSVKQQWEAEIKDRHKSKDSSKKESKPKPRDERTSTD